MAAPTTTGTVIKMGCKAMWHELTNPVVLTVAILGCWATVQPYLWHNVTVSLPSGWYWCRSHYTNEPLAPGTIVLFTPAIWMTDVLAATAPHLRATPPWMKRVDHEDGDDLYVIGTHPASLDSRHFGPIPRASVHAVCTPIWTKG
jgi:type IV secretory pathway protease TraF